MELLGISNNNNNNSSSLSIAALMMMLGIATTSGSSSSGSGGGMTTVNLLDLAASAVASAVAAARPIRELSERKNVRAKEDGSAVTDADFAAQGIIVRALRQVEGDFRIVGEESPEEMEQHMRQETPDEYTERQRIFRLAQRELRYRYNGIDTDRMPLAQAEDEQEDEEEEEEAMGEPPTAAENERPDYIVDANRVSVFVDPLDGTKAYAKGEYDTVTTLIAIILDNQPYFGVITKPFGYKAQTSILDTGCVTIYGGNLLRAVFVAGGKACPQPGSSSSSSSSSSLSGLPRAVISQSRSKGIVRDFVDHLAREGVVHSEPLFVSGAGEKSLRLVVGTEDETLWFFPKAGTSRWDVAASDAILRAFGGRVTDKYGEDLDYSTSRDDAENADGIIASNSASLHAECIRLFKEGNWHER